MSTENQSNTADREVVITRLINAPRELVFSAWTEPKHLVQWWGPNGFTNTFESIDIKPGGTWKFMMHGPDGTNFPNVITYDEVVKPERLVYLHTDDTGTQSFRTTVTFETQGTKTLLTMRVVFPTAEERDHVVKEFGAVEGGNQTISKLEAHIGKMTEKQEFIITRLFDAPLDLVWKVQSEAAHIVNWWGPAGMKMEIIRFDFRPGGLLHYCLESPDGMKMYGKAIYREIDAPHSMTTLVSFSDANEGVQRHPLSATWPLATENRMMLTEVNGQTRMTLTSSPGDATDEERKTFEEGAQGMQQGFMGMLEKMVDYVYEVKN